MREGELCPFCKKGRLYPKPEGGFSEPDITPGSDAKRMDKRTLVCDNCGEEVKDIAVVFQDNINIKDNVNTLKGKMVKDEIKSK